MPARHPSPHGETLPAPDPRLSAHVNRQAGSIPGTRRECLTLAQAGAISLFGLFTLVTELIHGVTNQHMNHVNKSELHSGLLFEQWGDTQPLFTGGVMKLELEPGATGSYLDC